jgi:hypothetical protein
VPFFSLKKMPLDSKAALSCIDAAAKRLGLKPDAARILNAMLRAAQFDISGLVEIAPHKYRDLIGWIYSLCKSPPTELTANFNLEQLLDAIQNLLPPPDPADTGVTTFFVFELLKHIVLRRPPTDAMLRRFIPNPTHRQPVMEMIQFFRTVDPSQRRSKLLQTFCKTFLPQILTPLKTVLPDKNQLDKFTRSLANVLMGVLDRNVTQLARALPDLLNALASSYLDDQDMGSVKRCIAALTSLMTGALSGPINFASIKEKVVSAVRDNKKNAVAQARHFLLNDVLQVTLSAAGVKDNRDALRIQAVAQLLGAGELNASSFEFLTLFCPNEWSTQLVRGFLQIVTKSIKKEGSLFQNLMDAVLKSRKIIVDVLINEKAPAQLRSPLRMLADVLYVVGDLANDGSADREIRNVCLHIFSTFALNNMSKVEEENARRAEQQKAAEARAREKERDAERDRRAKPAPGAKPGDGKDDKGKDDKAKGDGKDDKAKADGKADGKDDKAKDDKGKDDKSKADDKKGANRGRPPSRVPGLELGAPRPGSSGRPSSRAEGTIVVAPTKKSALPRGIEHLVSLLTGEFTQEFSTMIPWLLHKLSQGRIDVTDWKLQFLKLLGNPDEKIQAVLAAAVKLFQTGSTSEERRKRKEALLEVFEALIEIDFVRTRIESDQNLEVTMEILMIIMDTIGEPHERIVRILFWMEERVAQQLGNKAQPRFKRRGKKHATIAEQTKDGEKKSDPRLARLLGLLQMLLSDDTDNFDDPVQRIAQITSIQIRHVLKSGVTTKAALVGGAAAAAVGLGSLAITQLAETGETEETEAPKEEADPDEPDFVPPEAREWIPYVSGMLSVLFTHDEPRFRGAIMGLINRYRREMGENLPEQVKVAFALLQAIDGDDASLTLLTTRHHEMEKMRAAAAAANRALLSRVQQPTLLQTADRLLTSTSTTLLKYTHDLFHDLCGHLPGVECDSSDTTFRCLPNGSPSWTDWCVWSLLCARLVSDQKLLESVDGQSARVLMTTCVASLCRRYVELDKENLRSAASAKWQDVADLLYAVFSLHLGVDTQESLKSLGLLFGEVSNVELISSVLKGQPEVLMSFLGKNLGPFGEKYVHLIFAVESGDASEITSRVADLLREFNVVPPLLVDLMLNLRKADFDLNPSALVRTLLHALISHSVHPILAKEVVRVEPPKVDNGDGKEKKREGQGATGML